MLSLLQLQVIVPAAHMSPCLLCDDTTGECSQEPRSQGQGVKNADVVLYVSSKKSGNK